FVSFPLERWHPRLLVCLETRVSQSDPDTQRKCDRSRRKNKSLASPYRRPSGRRRKEGDSKCCGVILPALCARHRSGSRRSWLARLASGRGWTCRFPAIRPPEAGMGVDWESPAVQERAANGRAPGSRPSLDQLPEPLPRPARSLPPCRARPLGRPHKRTATLFLLRRPKLENIRWRIAPPNRAGHETESPC